MLPIRRPAPAAPSSLDVVIADSVRRLRASRGWRQQDLAAAAGWSRATVVAVEAGEKRLTVRDAAVLCKVLRVPLAELVAGAAEVEALGLAGSGSLTRPLG